MAVVRKVQSKISLPSREAVASDADSKIKENKTTSKKVSESKTAASSTGKEENRREGGRLKKYCHFCKSKNEPRYWDATALRRFISDRGRIHPRNKYGVCAKHQRRLSREIKRARHLSLLPFTAGI